MKAPVEPSHCPFATRARAAEIALRENALQEKFGLIEFTELTGVGHSDYGIYRIDPKGVSLRASNKLDGWPADQQNAINQVALRAALEFPCTPVAFMAWYDATRGAEGASDFPLADGFAEELPRHEEPVSQSAGLVTFPEYRPCVARE